MTFNESKEMFSLIYQDLSLVSSGDLKESELREIFDRNSSRNGERCELVKDMMAAIGSDAARRQNYRELAHHLIDSCKDSNLKRAAYAWLKSREGRK